MIATLLSQPEVWATSRVELLTVVALGSVIGWALGWWHHHICIEPRCFHKGHPDPEHGHPLCREHQRKLP